MLYTHCYGHALNLAVKDACFKVTILKEAFEISREVIKLVKDSPQRDTKLKAIRSEKSNKKKSVHAFCPTQWTVRGETLNAILNNFNELNLSDTEIKSRIRGVYTYMERFSYIFGCFVGK